MNSEAIKRNIENNLKNFDQQPLRDAATAFLNILGYRSKMVGNDDIDSIRFDRLIAAALETANQPIYSALTTGNPFTKFCR